MRSPKGKPLAIRGGHRGYAPRRRGTKLMDSVAPRHPARCRRPTPDSPPASSPARSESPPRTTSPQSAPGASVAELESDCDVVALAGPRLLEGKRTRGAAQAHPRPDDAHDQHGHDPQSQDEALGMEEEAAEDRPDCPQAEDGRWVSDPLHIGVEARGVVVGEEVPESSGPSPGNRGRLHRVRVHQARTPGSAASRRDRVRLPFGMSKEVDGLSDDSMVRQVAQIRQRRRFRRCATASTSPPPTRQGVQASAAALHALRQSPCSGSW